MSKRIRTVIARRANYRCEYCRSPAQYCIDPFVAEHIYPVAKGGLTETENLAFACMGCNGFKQDKVDAYDFVSQSSVSLYNPRTDLWHDHFAWNEGFTHMVPLSGVGRVTVEVLQLNREGVVNVRRLLILAGLHPPLR